MPFAVNEALKITYTINLINEQFGVPLLLSGHMNKKPMVLVVTVGTSTDAVQALKWVWYHWKQDQGTMQRTYYLIHLVVHSIYRMYFNVVDVHNRSRHGVRDMAAVWQCMFYGTHLIMTIFHFVAVKIFRQYYPGLKRKTVDGERDMTDMHLIETIALELIENTIDEDTRTSRNKSRTEPRACQPADPHGHEHIPEPIPEGDWNYQGTCSYCRDRNILNGVKSRDPGGGGGVLKPDTSVRSATCSCARPPMLVKARSRSLVWMSIELRY
jgi:hypothetical protein